MKKILVSIIIPTYNEEENIKSCLESLLKQSHTHFEVIVVDDGSYDGTLKILKYFSKNGKIKIIKGQHKGPGFSRNLGAKKAKGEILIFVDADMTFDKGYIKKLIAPILEDKSGSIIGTENEIQLASNFNKNIWTKCFGKDNFDSSSKIRWIFRAIKKDIFMDKGMFDPKYGYADDQTFLFRDNLRPDIAYGAICYHKNPESLKQLYKQSRWIGASLNNIFFRIPVIKYFSPIFLLVISPLAIILFSIKKCIKNKDFSTFFPWMFIFIAVRYIGTISGIFRKIYLNNNTR